MRKGDREWAKVKRGLFRGGNVLGGPLLLTNMTELISEVPGILRPKPLSHDDNFSGRAQVNVILGQKR